MFFKRGPDPLESVNLLEMAPVRIAAWKEIDDLVVIERPSTTLTGLRGFFERITYYLSVKRLRLDAYGSFSWKLIDGRKTVGEMAAAFQAEFGEQAEQADERLGRFIRVLRREGLVAYPGWDDLGVDSEV